MGDLAGKVMLLLPFNAFGLMGQGGKAMLTVLPTMGILTLQLPPHAGQSNFNGMMEALRSALIVAPVVIGRSRETLYVTS